MFDISSDMIDQLHLVDFLNLMCLMDALGLLNPLDLADLWDNIKSRRKSKEKDNFKM